MEKRNVTERRHKLLLDVCATDIDGTLVEAVFLQCAEAGEVGRLVSEREYVVEYLRGK